MAPASTSIVKNCIQSIVSIYFHFVVPNYTLATKQGMKLPQTCPLFFLGNSRLNPMTLWLPTSKKPPRSKNWCSSPLKIGPFSIDGNMRTYSWSLVLKNQRRPYVVFWRTPMCWGKPWLKPRGAFDYLFLNPCEHLWLIKSLSGQGFSS